MYWNARQYPSLANRPPAEQGKIIEAALKEHGGAFRKRLLLVVAAIAVGLFLLWPRAAVNPLASWRGLILPFGAALVLGAYLIWEVNGSIHTAVQKYLADRDKTPPPRG